MTQSDPQGVPKDPKRPPKSRIKSAPGATQAKKKAHTIPKLGFVDRRGVFEPPKPKVDYLYYVFGTLEIFILVKSVENTAPAMLLEPPRVEGGGRVFPKSLLRQVPIFATRVRGKQGSPGGPPAVKS